MSRSFYVLLLSCACLFTGCTTTQLLHADFESEADESFPNLDLPGPPSGDRMFFSGPRENPSGGDPFVQVVERADTTFWLEYFHQAGTSGPAYLLGFQSGGEVEGDESYVVTWRGEITYPPSPSMDLRIWVAGGTSHGAHNLVMLDLVYEVNPGNPPRAAVYLVENGRRTDRIGHVGQQDPHGIAISIKLADGTYAVAGGNAGGNVQSGERLLPDGMISDSPSVWFSFFNFPGVGHYLIDEVTISRID